MKPFKRRHQSAKTGALSRSRSCQWLEADIDGIRIVVDGSTEYSHKTIVRLYDDVDNVTIELPDTLLIHILRRYKEELSNQYINFIMTEGDEK